ncbi:MAG: hypothetical protein JO371_09170, partial [Paraburkholderia sp.]|nr:hypothetical protein [Paraburkholderia sp.]
QQLTLTVSLVKALGGGWDVATPLAQQTPPQQEPAMNAARQAANPPQ